MQKRRRRLSSEARRQDSCKWAAGALRLLVSVCRQSPPALRAGVTEGGREGGVLQRGAFGARYHLGAVSTSSLWDCGKDSHLPGHGGEGQGTPRTMWACVQFGDNAFLLLLTPGLSLILLCVCVHTCVCGHVGAGGQGGRGKCQILFMLPHY